MRTTDPAFSRIASNSGLLCAGFTIPRTWIESPTSETPNDRLKASNETVESYGLFARTASYLQSPFLLAVRLYWGWQFAQNGWGKLHNLSQIAHYFSTLNLPFPGFTAPFVAAVEFVGGILLILGLLSRFTGLVLSIQMFVAYWAGDHAALLSIFSDPGKFYVADPYTFLFASLMVLLFGAGLFSLDALGSRWLDKRMSQ